jgi:hypothetical protein
MSPVDQYYNAKLKPRPTLPRLREAKVDLRYPSIFLFLCFLFLVAGLCFGLVHTARCLFHFCEHSINPSVCTLIRHFLSQALHGGSRTLGHEWQRDMDMKVKVLRTY